MEALEKVQEIGTILITSETSLTHNAYEERLTIFILPPPPP